MSVVTHMIPQSFAEGQILNIVTSIPQQQDGSNIQNIVMAQTGEPGQIFPVQLSVPGLGNVQTSGQTPIQIDPKAEPSVEREKQNIYTHPLFPLMALMFERCEQASASPDFPSSENFDSDIQAFILHQEKEKKSLFVNDSDLDTLMIKAIQVLRIHLLELEKVTELCKDFCTRYTNCLKGKLQSENLLRTESDYDQSMFDEPPKELQQPVQNVSSAAGGGVILQQPFQNSVTALGPGQIMSGGTVYQMVHTPQGLVAQPLAMASSLSTPAILGSTPLSQIGVSPNTIITSPTTNTVVNTLGSFGSGFDSDDDDNGKKKTKRGVLPKSATQVMKSWLFQHIVHPYPTEDEKRQIATQTNLTLLQVNNWFINARRRILQPMLDAGNPEQAKAKKAKTPAKQPTRFWPFASSVEKTPGTVDLKVPTLSSVSSSSTSPATSITSSIPQSPSAGQTIVLPPGTFLMPDGQIMNLQTASMAAMLNTLKQTSPSPPPDKDSSDNNNNSHNTDNDVSDDDMS